MPNFDSDHLTCDPGLVSVKIAKIVLKVFAFFPESREKMGS